MLNPKEIHELAVSKGFWEAERNFGECLMLVVSELGETIEAHRHGDLQHVGEELADAVIRIFDLAEGFQIPLEEQMRRKHEINKTRPYKHGKLY